MYWIYRLLHLYRYIANYVYKSMINIRWITLPVVYSRPFVWKAVFWAILKFSTFLLRSLKAEQCDFRGKNRSGAGALSKQGFLPCPSIIRNSQQRTQTPSNRSKTTFEAKGRIYTTGKVTQRLFNIDLCSCLDTRQPGNVFKKLDTRQSEILTNFLEMARLIPLRT